MQAFWAWVRDNYKKALQFLAWAVLFWFGNAGLGTLAGVDHRVAVLQEKVSSLQGEKESLKTALDQALQLLERLRQDNESLQGMIDFLHECIVTLGQPRAPWDRFECPRPEPPQ